MTAQTPNPNLQEQEPFIPPFYMLILAAVGLVITIVVTFTQPTFTVVGWGGLGLAILSIVVWGFMAPDQVRSLVTGRTARYGGTTILVTLLFIMALIAIYSVVKGRSLRVDLTQRDDFSLNEDTRKAIAGLAVEPNVPKIKIFAFVGTADAGLRDQATVLLDDYVKTSQNKISYEFVDPERSPGVAKQYKAVTDASTTTKALAVVPLDASDQPIADKTQTVASISQVDLTNAIMRVAASGDFRVYFLTTNDTLKLTDSSTSGMSSLNDILKTAYNWKAQEVSIIDLTSPTSTIKLNDPTADGEVLVIAGGGSALSDAQVKYITDYLDKGGKLVIMAAALNVDGKPALANADNLSTYLYDKFGVRFANNVVLDESQAVNGLPFFVAAKNTDIDRSQPITEPFSSNANYFTVFDLARSIDVAPTAPADVTVSQLVKSSTASYAKTDPKVLSATDVSELKQADGDAKGPFVLAAAAENTKTGAKVVLLGSSDMGSNQFAQLLQQGVTNLRLTLNSLFWTTKFEDFFNKIPQVNDRQRPQDTPVFASGDTTRTMNFVTIVLMPFGILLIGILVWWTGREKRTTV